MKLNDSTKDALRDAGMSIVTGALVLSLIPMYAVSTVTTDETEATSATAYAQAETTTLAQASDASGSKDASGSNGKGSGNQNGQPPEKPDGDGGSDGASGQGGQPPEKPDGDGQGGSGGPGGGGGGANTMTFDYNGAYTGAVEANGSDEQASGGTYTATDADQNAAVAQNGGTLTLSGAQLVKSGDDTDGDNCNFYGLNSIATAVGEGSTIKMSDTSLSATSEGSNGIFATDGATVWANNVSISTTAGNSRGLDATYGGTVIANQMTIDTQGDHCAGVATDRGGGSISLTNATLSTAGSGSPLLYSTGDIQVSNVTGEATGSQLAGMEGLNTILINDSTLSSTVTGRTASDPIADGVIIYQSTSGDAESTTGETATFQTVNSTLSSAITEGSMFYLTNTNAKVLVQNTTLDFDASSAKLLYAAGNDANNWGNAGSNGATVSFTARDETMSGDITADTISSVTVYLLDGTTWTGAASVEENAAGSTSDAPVTVNVGGDSTWVVTDDSSVSQLNVAEGGAVVDASGRTVTVVADGSTVVQGDSDLTVTVTGAYSTTVDESGAATAQASTIDRSGFDQEFGTSTAFAMGTGSDGSTATSATTTTATSTGAGDSSASSGDTGILGWIKGLLGLS